MNKKYNIRQKSTNTDKYMYYYLKLKGEKIYE